MGRISRGIRDLEDRLRRAGVPDQPLDDIPAPRLVDPLGLAELRQGIALIEAAGQAFKAKDLAAVERHMGQASLILQSAEARLAG